jgi:hypothetical protein
MTAIENTSDAKLGLQAIQTDYYGIGGSDSMTQSFHAKWDATLVATLTVWACNFPEQLGSTAVATNSVVAGDWIQLDPPTGYTAISPAGAATIAAGPLTIVVPGGTAGGIFVDLGNTGARRLRVRVVCTTAGQLRIHAHGKM